jgi:hypothetical protein
VLTGRVRLAIFVLALLASCSGSENDPPRIRIVDEETGELNTLTTDGSEDLYLVEVVRRSPDGAPVRVERLTVLTPEGDEVEEVEPPEFQFNPTSGVPGKPGWNQTIKSPPIDLPAGSYQFELDASYTVNGVEYPFVPTEIDYFEILEGKP